MLTSSGVKHVKKTDMKEALRVLNQIKMEVISRGMPYSHARRIDDVIATVDTLMNGNTEKGKK